MIVIRVLFQTVFLALGQIWANKTRALLTALGIIIGVASVIAVIAGLGGLRSFVLQEFETIGARKVYVWGWVPQDLRATMSWSEARVTRSEAEFILEHAEAIEMLTPVTNRRYDVRAGSVLARGVQVIGIWPEWHDIEDRQVMLGRPFVRADDEDARQVCIVNETAIEELELPADPTGAFLLINQRRFLVVGVVETKDATIFQGGGDTSTAEVLIPLQTAYTMNPYDWVTIVAQMRDTNAAEEARAQIRHVLRTQRNLAPDAPDTFRIEILQSFIDQFNSLAAGITAVAGAVVSISLLVGGIGIMNIMLVSVSERTREIGLRKAVGARPGVILTQFLVEAVVLCSVGGLIGLAIGQGITIALQHIPQMPLEGASIPPWAIALAFAFSGGVGVVFGMFPAIKAARLNPIDALRHE
ncbi:MAG: FtsX-like permease family protein [Phycisphaerales bacterium]|nr:MAG: FtsX-like permease family protein [Phycisphaerales bacterium]